MKHVRRIFAFALTLVMAFAMCATAIADDKYTITVTNNNDSISIDGQTYSAYKLFDLTYNGDAHSYTIKTNNYFYTNNGAKGELDKYFKFTASAADPTVMVVEPKSEITDESARALADALQPYISGATATAEEVAGGQTATIDVGADGYYIVTGTATPTDTAGSETVVSAVILTNAKPTASVEPKVSVPTIDKKITSVRERTSGEAQAVSDAILDNNGKAAVAKVGSTVSFQIDAITPDLRGYSNYTYTITDTLSSGLTYANNFVLKIGGDEVDLKPIVNGQTWTLTIPYNTLKNYTTAGTAVVITYDATLNAQALSTDYEKNTVKLTYSNSPYTSETNDTPDKEVYVIDINVDVNKVAKTATGSALSGAKFILYRTVSNTTEYYQWDTANDRVAWTTNKANADTFVTNSSGNLGQVIRGLDAGEYYLLETEAPAGYNPLPAAVKVKITATETDNTTEHTVVYAAEDANVTNGTINLNEDANSNQPLAVYTIINNTGTVMPSTGGIGTTIFYIVGGVMVAGAAIFLLTKRRMAGNE